MSREGFVRSPAPTKHKLRCWREVVGSDVLLFQADNTRREPTELKNYNRCWGFGYNDGQQCKRSQGGGIPQEAQEGEELCGI
jgi:hypothetical protein